MNLSLLQSPSITGSFLLSLEFSCQCVGFIYQYQSSDLGIFYILVRGRGFSASSCRRWCSLTFGNYSDRNGGDRLDGCLGGWYLNCVVVLHNLSTFFAALFFYAYYLALLQPLVWQELKNTQSREQSFRWWYIMHYARWNTLDSEQPLLLIGSPCILQ